VLPAADFVVAGLHDDPHGAQGIVHPLADRAGDAARGVEVAGLIVKLERARRGRLVEQVELELGRDDVAHAHRLGQLQRLAQRAARIPGEGLPVGRVHVAEQARRPAHLAVGRLPGDDGECAGVGLQVHVGFGHPREALHRRAVEPDSVLEGGRQVIGVDGHGLDHARHIGELEVHRPDIVLAHELDDSVRACRLNVRHRMSPDLTIRNLERSMLSL